jgi:hypothetical protein
MKTECDHLFGCDCHLCVEKKQISQNEIRLVGIFGFILTSLLLSFLLMTTKTDFLSLNAILNWENHLPHNEQLLAIGIIPFYLSFIIFGGGVLGSIFSCQLIKNLIKYKHKGRNKK